MSISDLVVTKPGGLTTSESLASHLPMVIINPIPGQEEENAEFLESKGIAIWLKKHDDIDAEIVEHKESDELERISVAEAISEAQEVLNKHFKSDDSYRLQCSYFLNAFLCTEEEYYRATQLINYKALSWWLENKKTTSLKYFIGDVKTGQRKGRFKDRIEFYKTMLGHLRAEQQELFKEAEGRLGFKSLLDRVLELLRDSRKLDDSWL